MEPMTSEEYIKDGGLTCPNCRTKDSVRAEGSLNIFGRYAWQTCKCSECGAEWNDSYTLEGYEGLEV